MPFASIIYLLLLMAFNNNLTALLVYFSFIQKHYIWNITYDIAEEFCLFLKQ